MDLLILLEHRLKSVAAGHMALSRSMSWEEAPSIQILFDGDLVIEGKATAYTNPAIEVAIIHARALLEFLGLGLERDSQTKLKELPNKRKNGSDYGVEQFGTLVKVPIMKAIGSYPGPAEDAEAALAYVIYLANKGLAHTTTSFTKHDQDVRLLDIALRGVPVLVVNNFYKPLGIPPPDYILPRRKRPPQP